MNADTFDFLHDNRTLVRRNNLADGRHRAAGGKPKTTIRCALYRNSMRHKKELLARGTIAVREIQAGREQK